MAWIRTSARAQVLCALIVAGTAAATSFDVPLEVGDTLSTVIVTGLNADDACNLKTPEGKIIEIGRENHLTGRIKYIETNFISYCGAKITNLTEEDEGDWTIFFIGSNGKRIFNTYHLTVSKEDNPSKAERDVQEQVTTQRFRVIDIMTRTGSSVNIALSKRDDSLQETFSIITNKDEVLPLDNLVIPGVTVQGGSDFVANRVTIGPVSDDMRGVWSLCGQTAQNTRCQPVDINWGNVNNPSEQWNTTIATRRDIVANNLGVTDVTVRGAGGLLSCHVITPTGDDITVNSDSTYPGITFKPVQNSYLCTVSLGPLYEHFIGDWTIYAQFNSNSLGRSEVRMSFSISLNNEEELPSEVYDGNTLSPSTQRVSLGASTTLTLSGKGSTENCDLRSPTGNLFNLDSSSETVKFLSTDKTVRCRVEIGPIGQNELGDWVFTVRFSYKGRSTENRQTVSLVLADEDEGEEDPSQGYAVTTLNPLTRMVSLGTNATLTLSGKGSTDSCELRSPSGESFNLQRSSDTVTFLSNDKTVRCRVEVGPIGMEKLGDWLFIVRFNYKGRFTENRQTVSFVLEENELLSEIRIATRIGLAVDISLSKKDLNTKEETFTLTTPSNQTVQLENANIQGVKIQGSSEFVDSRVTIGPMDESLIGRWTLCGEVNVPMTVKRCQPVVISWNDADHPSSDWNTTVLSLRDTVTNYEATNSFSVRGSGSLQSCHLITPEGEDLVLNTDSVYPGLRFVSNRDTSICSVTLGPIFKQFIGEWTMYATYVASRGGMNEVRMPINLFLYDEENPYSQAYNVTTQNTLTRIISLGASLNFDLGGSGNTDSCEIRSPQGQLYNLLNATGIVAFSSPNSNVHCRLTLGPLQLNNLGDWTFVAKFNNRGIFTEIRQPISILAEENVDASVSEVTVTEGNDLIVRLARPTNHHDSCTLIDPFGTERTDREIDSSHIDTCGFIVRNVNSFDNGKWQIRYTDSITYIANINVIVIDKYDWEESRDKLHLIKGRSANLTIGPENAVYCKLTDPTKRVVFEGHGRCVLALDRVNGSHFGIWTIDVGFRGSMLARTFNFEVEARSLDKSIVTTTVTKEQPQVTLKCTVPVQHDVESCLFQDPSGRVIIVNDGVAEDKYISHSGTTVDGDVTIHECGIRIKDPSPSDLGLWRCAVETKEEIYYGFLEVLCPWAMQDPEIAAEIISEPTLVPREENLWMLETDSLTMTCSIKSPIRYCYFQGPNGMIYSVSPGASSDKYEYVGAGFDAGECGIRFASASEKSDHWQDGGWSCHVGLPNKTQPEQKADLHVIVASEIEAYQRFGFDGVLSLEGYVYLQRPLEYCRYVRIDGLGFTLDNIPDERYSAAESLSIGHCGLNIVNPTLLDSHPWTIAAKIIGKNEEVIGVTSDKLVTPKPTVGPSSEATYHPTPTETTSEYTPLPYEPEVVPGLRKSSSIRQLFVASLIATLIISVAIYVLIPTKNGNAFLFRAAAFRDSVRRGFTKRPLVAEPLPRKYMESHDTAVIA